MSEVYKEKAELQESSGHGDPCKDPYSKWRVTCSKSCHPAMATEWMRNGVAVVRDWNTSPAEDRKADEDKPRFSFTKLRQQLADAKAERDALKAVIERLTGDAAVEAAWNSLHKNGCLNMKADAKEAVQAAIEASK